MVIRFIHCFPRSGCYSLFQSYLPLFWNLNQKQALRTLIATVISRTRTSIDCLLAIKPLAHLPLLLLIICRKSWHQSRIQTDSFEIWYFYMIGENILQIIISSILKLYFTFCKTYFWLHSTLFLQHEISNWKIQQIKRGTSDGKPNLGSEGILVHTRQSPVPSFSCIWLVQNSRFSLHSPNIFWPYLSDRELKALIWECGKLRVKWGGKGVDL